MSEARWSEHNTTPERVESALRELLRERHAANATLAPARALNLVVIADREWRGEVANRLERIGTSNPSRTILCAYEEGRGTIDARAVISGDETGTAASGCCGRTSSSTSGRVTCTGSTRSSIP